MDDYEKQISGYQTQVNTLVDSNVRLTTENKTFKKELEILRVQLEDLEQYNRNKNLQIDGVPDLKNENIEEVVNKLSDISGEEDRYQISGYDMLMQPRLENQAGGVALYVDKRLGYSYQLTALPTAEIVHIALLFDCT
ncbi:hypothetical protein J6590_006042, partial [Homalodisca vitripennis]